MKDRRGSSSVGGGERFAVFPFSMGCMSQSAVSVADPGDKKAQGDPSSTAATVARAGAGSSEEGAGEAMTKEKAVASSAAAAAATAPGLVAAGVSRLMKGIRSLSQMFAGEDGGEDEDDDEEREMVIGYPTDVQHVGHIGWDGHNSKAGAAAAAMAGMVNAFSLPSSLSLRHLDMAMDRAAAHASA